MRNEKTFMTILIETLLTKLNEKNNEKTLRNFYQNKKKLEEVLLEIERINDFQKESIK